MTARRFTQSLCFALPFLVALFFLRSSANEYINNAEVRWQYVVSQKGRAYLALDVFAPSGIELEGIYYKGKDITDGWERVSAPTEEPFR